MLTCWMYLSYDLLNENYNLFIHQVIMFILMKRKGEFQVYQL